MYELPQSHYIGRNAQPNMGTKTGYNDNNFSGKYMERKQAAIAHVRGIYDNVERKPKHLIILYTDC